jgi:hypothetical protein
MATTSMSGDGDDISEGRWQFAVVMLVPALSKSSVELDPFHWLDSSLDSGMSSCCPVLVHLNCDVQS